MYWVFSFKHFIVFLKKQKFVSKPTLAIIIMITYDI